MKAILFTLPQFTAPSNDGSWLKNSSFSLSLTMNLNKSVAVLTTSVHFPLLHSTAVRTPRIVFAPSNLSEGLRTRRGGELVDPAGEPGGSGGRVNAPTLPERDAYSIILMIDSAETLSDGSASCAISGSSAFFA